MKAAAPGIFAFSFLLFSGCICQAVEYGLRGTPRVEFVSPACNSTVSSAPAFSFAPKPDGADYDHYLVQIKKGSDWNADNFISKDEHKIS